jgi:dienelactone hydrolase
MCSRRADRLRRALGVAILALPVNAIAVLAPSSRLRAAEPEAVSFVGPVGVTLKAQLYKPAGITGARPAVIALHGCGGNLRADATGLVARVPDWTNRFLSAGYTVLWPDSFGSRGLGSQCQVSNREITPAMRASDAVAAADWLVAQSNVDTSRIALVGWSNGGSTVLRAVAAAAKAPATDFKTAIAFYPGCRPIVEREARDAKPWATRMPLTILMGAADDWTPPEPCRVLGTRTNVRYVEYPGAYHDFDAPNVPIRVRTGLAMTANKSGQAHVGTDPAARAAAIDEVMRLLSAAFK